MTSRWSRKRDWSYYALWSTRFFDIPYGVLRFDSKDGRIERYNTDTLEWDYSPTEADMLVDPDPGESARPITETECEALMQGGTLR